MIGDSLKKRLEVYKPRNTPCYREIIEWLNTTEIRDIKTLAKNVLIRLPKLGKNVPSGIRRQWLARQLALAINMHEATTK